MKVLQLSTIVFLLTVFGSCNRPEPRKNSVHPPEISSNTHSRLTYIITEIEKGKRVESEYVGYSSSRSNQWSRFEQLKAVATLEQLVKLTDHKDAAVRCYAFQALASKRSNKVFPILLNHLQDTATVGILNSDVGSMKFVGDYFIDVVTPDHSLIDGYTLTNKQRQVVDSILVNDITIHLDAKARVLETLKPISKNYERIKELVKKDRNTSALMALAKYHNQADKQLISTFFRDDNTQTDALYAVREFPDDFFYSQIKVVFENEWKKDRYDYSKWRICYQALAQYPRPETFDLFERTINSKDKIDYTTFSKNDTRYNILCKYLLIAITKYPDKLYAPIKRKIKLEKVYMDEVMEELDNDY